MKVPNLIRNLSDAEVAKIDSKNESSICETVKKEKEIVLVLLLHLKLQKLCPWCMISA